MSSGDFKIEYVNVNDRPRIVEFLHRNFYRDEPITDYLKICENTSALEALKTFSTKNLYQNLSFVVTDATTGNWLGVCVNAVHTRNDPEENVDDPLFGKIARFLGYGYGEARVFQKYTDVESVLYMDILSVDSSAAGRGIGTLMVKHAANQLLKPSTVAIANIPDKNFSVVPVGGNPAHVNNIPKISQQQTRSAVTDTQKLHYQIIDAKDSSEVLDFLKENFFADEPLNRAVGILENTESVKAMSVYSTKGIEQNISYLARSESGELVGVSLNSVKGKCDPEDDPETDPIFGKISRILGFAYDDSKFFEKFPDVDRVVSVDIISVDKKFQGHGIAKVLMDKTRDLARKKGIKMIRVDCTSHFSARASEKLGMQCIYELKYSDYKENGVQVFKPEPPHTGLKVYVQRLDS